jgi:hypothetical protein
MNFMNDQYMLLVIEGNKHEQFYPVRDYDPVNLYPTESPTRFIRYTCCLLLILSRLMFTWGARLQSYSFALDGRNTRLF